MWSSYVHSHKCGATYDEDRQKTEEQLQRFKGRRISKSPHSQFMLWLMSSRGNALVVIVNSRSPWLNVTAKKQEAETG